MRQEKPHKKTSVIALLCILLLLPVAASTQLFFDQQRVTELATQQAEQVLYDSARRQTDMLSTMLDAQFNMLRAVAGNISVSSDDFSDQTEMLRLYSDISAFSLLCLVNEKGTAHYPDGSMQDVSDRFYFNAAKNGKEAIQWLDAGRSDGKPRFVLAVPYRYNGKLGAVFGALEISAFDAMVSTGAYSNEGVSYVTDAAGRVYLGAAQNGFTGAAPSLFQMFNAASYEDNYSLTRLRIDLNAGHGGSFMYTPAGQSEQYYVCFYPMRLNHACENEWFVFNVIPGRIIQETADSTQKNSARNIIVVMLAGLVATAALLYRERINRRQILADAERLRASEETGRIALEMTDKIISRYDIVTRVWHSQSAYVSNLPASMVMENMPESMIDSGMIALESVEEYRAFYTAIHAGEPRGRCVVRIIRQDGTSYWEQNDFVTIFSAEGVPVSAVISAEDITLRREMELAYQKWRQTVNNLPQNRVTVYEHNLTRDRCESMEGTLLPPFPAGGYAGFNERTSLLSRRFVSPEDAENFRQFVNRQRLLAEFANGNTEQSLLFRRGRDAKKEHYWTRLTIQMVSHAVSNEVMAYMLFEDVDELKREELLLLARSERDALTGAYDRATFQRRVEELFKKTGTEAIHAIIMLDVDNFKRINDSGGHDAGDKALIDMAETLHATMRPGDLVGRLGGDEFMICFCSVPSREVVAKRAEELCRALRTKTENGIPVACSLGIVLYPKDGTGFHELYKKADMAMYRTKHSGKDGFTFYGDEAGEKE